MIIQGLVSGFLTILSYVLIVQYLYAYGYRKENDQITSRLEAHKTLIPPSLIVFAICLVMWLFYCRLTQIMATATLFLAFWIVGSLIRFLFARSHRRKLSLSELEEGKTKQQDSCEYAMNLNTQQHYSVENNVHDETSDTKTLVKNAVEITRNIFKNLKTAFFLQTPLISISAALIIIIFMYFLLEAMFQFICHLAIIKYSPYAAILFLAFRVGAVSSKRLFSYLLLSLTLAVNMFLVINDVDLSSTKFRIILAILLLGDWILTEIKYVITKLGARILWGVLQAACFLVLALYHMMLADGDLDLTEIILPRTVWVLIISLCVLKKVLNTNGLAMDRNLQLCLLQFLFLLQSTDQAFFFIFMMTVMRVTNDVLAKILKPANYLYPFVIVMETYFAFFLTGQTDRDLPMDFTAGFIGLHDYNPILSTLMVFMNVTGCFILGMMFTTYYNQQIKQQMPEDMKIAASSNESDLKGPPLKITARVIVKRNIIFFVFLVGIAFYGAFLKCLIYKDERLWSARNRYDVDGCLYILLMGWGCFALAFT